PGEKLQEELSVSGRLEHVPGRDGVLVDAEPAPPRDELDALLAQLARAVRRGDAAAVRRALALPRVGLSVATVATVGAVAPRAGRGLAARPPRPAAEAGAPREPRSPAPVGRGGRLAYPCTLATIAQGHPPRAAARDAASRPPRRARPDAGRLRARPPRRAAA